jgi:aminoglycoside phosphotransferase (APT) family kinase protein
VDAPLRERVERILGGRLAAATPVPRGYTPAQRWVVALEDGRHAFVKAAVNDMTAGWLRTEHHVYTTLAGRPFVPQLLGWEDGELPLVVLEDLSGERWPPPWRPGDVEAVLATLDTVHTTPPPHDIPAATAHFGADGWALVAQDPAAFLALGLATEAWLTRALPRLREAEADFPLDGAALLHLDVRSDNLCLRAGGAVLVDWNHACVGNPTLDLAFWLPSLEVEGGPAPEALLPGAPEAAAAVSGYFAARAGLPTIESAPRVRTVQLEQLRSALPWAARALDLDPVA